jgi:serine/arginine repetitive matrix protein 1
VTGDGDPLHQIASAMFTYLEEVVVADVEAVAIDLVSAVAHLRAVVLHLHHLVVYVAHHRQNPLDLHHHDVERGVLHQLAAQDLLLVVRVVGLLPAASLHPQDEGEIGLEAATAGGHPGTFLDLIPQPEISRAHQRPGCDHVHDHELLPSAGAAPCRALCLQALYHRGGADVPRHLVLIQTALAPISKSVNDPLALADHDLAAKPVGLDVV